MCVGGGGGSSPPAVVAVAIAAVAVTAVAVAADFYHCCRTCSLFGMPQRPNDTLLLSLCLSIYMYIYIFYNICLVSLAESVRTSTINHPVKTRPATVHCWFGRSMAAVMTRIPREEPPLPTSQPASKPRIAKYRLQIPFTYCPYLAYVLSDYSFECDW